MKVLVLSQHFWPESFRINELVASLTERGIAVSVLTGKPNYPEGKVFTGYSAIDCMVEEWSGANIYRVPVTPRGSKNGFRLALNYLSFIFSASIVGAWMLRKNGFDLIFVYATSPLLQALPALLIGWIKRVPIIIYVQDLWPESLEATGYIKNRFILWLVGLLVGLIYRRAALILTSSRPFEASIKRFSPSADIIYYPNSVDPLFCDPDAGAKPDIPCLGDGFCVVFAGNVGAAQAVHVITEAAALLKDHPDIRLVVLGSGSKTDWMRAQIAERGLDNLFLAGRFPVQAMPSLLSRASVLLVTLADREIFTATVPNKIQAYMAVGRAIIASMNGEGARIVQEADAGIAVQAEDVKGLAEAILRLHAMPQAERERLGENAQNYYRRNFNHESLVTELISYFVKIKTAKK